MPDEGKRLKRIGKLLILGGNGPLWAVLAPDTAGLVPKALLR